MGEALVAVRLPFDAAFTTTIDAAWEAGDAVLPVHPDLPDPEVEALLAALRPGFLVDASGIRRLPGAEAVEPGTAFVVPTSGTTGRPKGVVLTHDNLSASALATVTRLELGEGDRWLCCVPPSHIAGLMVLVRARLTGGVTVLHPRFDPAAIAGEESTNIVSLRWILLGGGPVSASLVAAATEAGARVVATYGMTETCGGVVYDGVPLPGVRVAIGEDGSIALAGPMVMRGYRLRPDETAAVLRDGWFHTSDAGEVDASGRLRVLGRRDDLIITGGQKVLPVEVASLLMEHPDVADAAVAGRPDDQWGQAVAAVVVPAPGSIPTLAALRAFVAERLAAYKAPRYLVIVEELPRGPTGKPVGLDALVAGPSAVSS
jgi:O-succinylbenzoic acid--CoA ligase